MVKVREIVRQNPWWNQGMGFASYDPHLIKTHPIFFQRKEIDLVRGNIYVLRGCRQVGKSTYLKTIIKQLIEGGVNPKHILYLSLDFFTSRRELRNTINYFLNETQEAEIIYMLLDEITFLKDWNLEFKYLADQGITGKSIIIATGSSAVKLKEKGELLPGRGLEGNEYYIKPLSFREFSLQSIKFIRGILPNNELRDSLERLEENLNRTSIDLSLDLQDI
ncbi:MAG: AAA family ATPase, partial [Candidatus Auribacterota bacterium]|nr:AAA family ATPase [Candidatus Auribacterota bacterium]